MDKITFKLDGNQRIIINKNGKEVGHIITPSSSADDITNAIQICGFSEAFDLWGCGVYTGFKDIQLLFDDTQMSGKDQFDLDKCIRCYREPCQCETRVLESINPKQKYNKELVGNTNPFIVKREHQLKSRLKKLRKSVSNTK